MWGAQNGRAAERATIRLGLLPLGFALVSGGMMAAGGDGVEYMVFIPLLIAMFALRMLFSGKGWQLGVVDALGFAASLIQIWEWPPVKHLLGLG